MALIVHPGILANKSNKGWRITINRKARFVGAVKLNDHSFSHSHTAIQPDILLFRKHPEGMEQRLQTFSVNDMYGSAYVQEDWINGAYFSNRQRHIMGMVQHGKGQWNSDVVSGSVTPETLEAILSAFEPEPFIPEYEHDKLRKAVRLHNETVKTSNLSLSDDEAEALERKTLPVGSVKIVDTSVYLLSDTYRWNLVGDNPALTERMGRILKISKDVQAIRKQMRGELNVSSNQSAVKSALTAYKECHGEYPKDDNLVSRFLRNHPSVHGVYDALIDPASDILTVANLYDGNGNPVNGHNRAIEALLFMQRRMLPATADTISRYFPNETEELTTEMHRNPDIFLSEHGEWQLREDFISGGAWGKIDALNELVTTEEDTARRDKWRYGIGELEKAVGWIPIEDADFSPIRHGYPNASSTHGSATTTA